MIFVFLALAFEIGLAIGLAICKMNSTYYVSRSSDIKNQINENEIVKKCTENAIKNFKKHRKFLLKLYETK